MKNIWLKKGLVIGIIGLFIGTGVSSAITEPTSTSPQPLDRGNWLYVGGSGPGNYTRIQDAIDAALDNDTVYVYNGTYYEHLTIHKSIYLIGENKSNTTIDGGGNGNIIYLNCSNTLIQSFNLQNAKHCIYIYNSSKINIINNNINDLTNQSEGLIELRGYNYDLNISSNVFTMNGRYYWAIRGKTYNSTVSRNVFNRCGIGGDYSYCLFSNNTFINGRVVFSQVMCSYTKIIDNILEGASINVKGYNILIARNYISDYGKNLTGIFGPFLNSNISYNTITNWNYGINIGVESNVTIYMNNITNCTISISINYGNFFSNSRLQSNEPSIVKNNNIGKGFLNGIFAFKSYISNNCVWDGNYWGRTRSYPKFIIGFREIVFLNENLLIPIRFNFDWHPAKQPYDIPRIAI